MDIVGKGIREYGHCMAMFIGPYTTPDTLFCHFLLRLLFNQPSILFFFYLQLDEKCYFPPHPAVPSCFPCFNRVKFKSPF